MIYEITKLEFVSLANQMLCRAVEEIAYDLGKDIYNPKDNISEPSYIAAIVSKFPDLMNSRWGLAKFGGCFIHQSPYVNFKAKNKKRRCEVGDLLCLCKKTVDGKVRYNATLFQIKKDKTKDGNVKPDNISQRLLYTEWPVLSFDHIRAGSSKDQYDIYPKVVTPGAQYMFINRYVDRNCTYCDCCGCYFPPVVFSHEIPSSVMKNTSEHSLGSFLWGFIHWQNGRPISDPDADSRDDWSELIWELVIRTKNNVYNINKKNPNWHICNLRSNGDFFAFMTKMSVGDYDDFMYSEWLNLEKDAAHESRKYINDKIIESKGQSVDEDYKDGLSILFIDLDKDEFEEKE